ncbi:ras association domain-containing protein 10-like [Macrosteles quadrilineatus]|uniref:ras association domain-containing protein 10-like n=1 Tax=Macrosteles quadrilineatus TaxID=74068 RepID=UPI0023E0DD6E|nr:ras association domain-containing protein 10-like [Macrosteles quadrilineatus]XP_054262887.1 ras association domain-containing protein 10-like [Macrosteles quadrilineatus]
MTGTGEVPVWVSGQQLWVRGVDRKTTVSDVITALLGRPDEGYVLVERWRKVERPLNNDTRLLKLWAAWGEEQRDVRLSLRRVADDDSGRGSPASVSRRRKHYRQKQHLSQTVHPRRLAQISKSQNIERLLKLILVQGETIQNQLKRLHDRDDQIDNLEEQKHRTRTKLLGSNYLLETYLGDACGEEEEKENDSGVVTEQPSSENTSTPTGEDTKEEDDDPTIEEDLEAEIHDLQKRIELWEKIVRVNKKLEKEEESVLRLTVAIKRSDELSELRGELDRLREETERNAKELERTTCTLTETDTALDCRRRYLRRLQLDLEVTDGETERLTRVAEGRSKGDHDSGLSSLHSSSEECTYHPLDTLV